MKNIKEIINNEGFLVGVVVVLVFILIFVVIFNIKYIKSEKAYADVIIIGGCKECFDLNLVLEELNKNENLEIKSEKKLEYESKEAKKLLEDYEIEKVPAIIIKSRDIEKINLDKNLFFIRKNYAIFDKAVPYIDLKTNILVGLVEIKEIQDISCSECSNFSSILNGLKNIKIKIENYEIVSSSSEKGKELIKENNIIFLNALLISKEIQEYWWIFSSLKNNLIEQEEYFVFSEKVYPYKELNTGIIKGKTNFIYLTDKNCVDCFNITNLKKGFQGLGVYITNEKNVDISSSEGKKIISKYKIKDIPTLIISKEISAYESLKEILDKLGTIEEDGSFVFRDLESLNVKYQKI